MATEDDKNNEDGLVESVQLNTKPLGLWVNLVNGHNYVAREYASAAEIFALAHTFTAAFENKVTVRIHYEDVAGQRAIVWVRLPQA